MTTTLILRYDDREFEQRDGVQYAEEAMRSRDKVRGVAIQYDDGTTEFEPGATIVGVYPMDGFDPFDDEYEALVDQQPTI